MAAAHIVPSPATHVIETRDLVKRFPRHRGWRNLLTPIYRTALDGVSLNVRRGEIFGLLGPNGAGKTTIMKILATLVLPNQGRAFVNGLDVTQHSTEVRRSIGFVYGDERTFYWRLSVRENLRFYSALYRMPSGLARRRIDELLDVVGLAESADVRMHYFSTGMKQRAAIARGLLTEPDIVFMDEPTRSLDPVGTYEIHQLIRRHVLGDRRTVLLATNNMPEAEALCDRVALLNHGRIQVMGTLGELHRKLSGDDRIVLTVSDISPQDVVALESVPGVLWARGRSAGDDRWSIELGVGRHSDAVPRCVRQLVGVGATIWSCVPQELSLDDMFRLAVRSDGQLVERQLAKVSA